MDNTPPAYADLGTTQASSSSSSQRPVDDLAHLFTRPEPAEPSLTTDLPSGVAWKPNFKSVRYTSHFKPGTPQCLIYHDASLKEPRALHDFIRRHAGIKPKLSLKIRGWHRKSRDEADGPNTQMAADGWVVNDFNFWIDLTEHLPSSEEGTQDRISLTKKSPYAPGHRGSMQVTYHPDVMQQSLSGAKYAPLVGDPDVSPGVIVSQEQLESWKARVEKRVGHGAPVSHAWAKQSFNEIQKETLFRSDDESAIGDEAGQADLLKWCEAYCACNKPFKEFHMAKAIYGWDKEALVIAIKDLIQALDYKGDGVEVTFNMEDHRIVVKPDTFLSKLTSATGFVHFLLCVTFVLPAIWLIARHFGSAIFGGQLAQYPMQLYVPVSPDDKTTPATERVRRGPDDHQEYVLKGLSEREFMARWRDAIKEAVRDRYNGSRKLDQPDPVRSESLARRVAAVTEGL